VVARAPQAAAAGARCLGARHLATGTQSQRVAALLELQEQADALSASTLKEMQALRRKLHADSRELRRRRAELVAGAELAGEELALEPAAPDVMQGLHEMGVEGDSMTGFWQVVLQRTLFYGQADEDDIYGAAPTSKWLNEDDIDALSFCTNVEIDVAEAGDGEQVKFSFHFAENPYFSDSLLTAVFERDENGDLVRGLGCSIAWKDPEGLTQRTIRPKPPKGGKGKKGKKGKGELLAPKGKVVPRASFFHLFSEIEFDEEAERELSMDDEAMGEDDGEDAFFDAEREQVMREYVEQLERKTIPDAIEVYINAPDMDMDFEDEMEDYEDDVQEAEYRDVGSKRGRGRMLK